MTRFQSTSRLSFVRLAAAATAIVLLQAACDRGGSGEAANQSPADVAAQTAVMQKGLDLLYNANDPAAAADTFRSLLKMHPTHYGARFQLAQALDMEARLLWAEILMNAESINDTATAAAARARLARPDTVSQAAMMTIGLNLLYGNGDGAGAADQFRKVLQKNPTHYGAIFQLAKALDLAGKSGEARPYWQKVLMIAEAIKDKSTADTARARLKRPDVH